MQLLVLFHPKSYDVSNGTRPLALSLQICPICAALPGGDPNHVTDDFTAHLTLEHRAPRDLISFPPPPRGALLSFGLFVTLI